MRPTRISGKLLFVIPIILILFISSYIYPGIQAQSNTSFSSANQFLIPSYNGAISFAANGSYSKAALENEVWTFENLNIHGSTPLQNFSVSSQNSNVTIFSFFSSNNATTTLRFRYSVEGSGKQIFNFGLQGHVQNAVDWTIVKTVNRKNIFLTPGPDFTISSNGTIVVNGATGNYTIDHFNFNNNNNLFNSKLPFYEQHSIAIVTSIVVAIVVVLAVVVAVKNTKFLTEKKLGNGVQTKNGDFSSLNDKEKT